MVDVGTSFSFATATVDVPSFSFAEVEDEDTVELSEEFVVRLAVSVIT